MGKLYGGYMGGFSGKLGPAVGYMWNGKWCVRSHQPLVNNPRTPAQVAHRDMFKREVQTAASMRWAVTTCLTDEARLMGMTSYNLFVHLNQEAFSLVDSQLHIDYSLVQLSVGDVRPVVAEGAEYTADNVVEVSFDKNGGAAYDSVYLYIYCPELERGFLTTPAYRRVKRISALLPDEYAGREVHLYLMVQNDRGQWSVTSYGGSLLCDETAGAQDEALGAGSVSYSSTDASRRSPSPKLGEEQNSVSVTEGAPPLDRKSVV